MDKSKIYKRKNPDDTEQNIFRHNKIFNIVIKYEYIDPEYSLDYSEQQEISETGRLNLVNIIPKNNNDPLFKARWDEFDNNVDVDMYNVSKSQIKNFKKEEYGYSGHHSNKINSPNRIFSINIQIPAKLIFKGTISFNLNCGHDPLLF